MHPYYYSCPLSHLTSHRSSPPTGVQAFAPTTHGGAHPRLSRLSRRDADGLKPRKPTWTRSWLRSHPRCWHSLKEVCPTTKCPPGRGDAGVLHQQRPHRGTGTAGTDLPRSVPQQHLPGRLHADHGGGRGASLQPAHPAFEPDWCFSSTPGQYLPQRAVLFPLIRGHHHARKHFFHHAVPHRRMPDVMADACVGDDQGNLIFPVHLGARHRRPAVPLLAWTLGRDEQDWTSSIITDQAAASRCSSATSIVSGKRVTRAYRRTLFGSLSNVAVRPPLRQARQGQRQRTGTAAARQRPPARPPVDAGAGHLPIAAARPPARDRAGTAAKPRDAGLPSTRPRAAGRLPASHRRAGMTLALFADPQ